MRKYSRINKNRKSGINRSYLRMKKERKMRMFSFAGVKLQIQLNNRNGIIDVRRKLSDDTIKFEDLPRIEGLLERVYGRQWGLTEVKNSLRDECINFQMPQK